MTDKELTEWEHQPHVLNVLTSREMGAWLCRRENRLLYKIRAEIADLDDADYGYEGYYKAVIDAVKIINKYMAESEEV